MLVPWRVFPLESPSYVSVFFSHDSHTKPAGSLETFQGMKPSFCGTI